MKDHKFPPHAPHPTSPPKKRWGTRSKRRKIISYRSHHRNCL